MTYECGECKRPFESDVPSRGAAKYCSTRCRDLKYRQGPRVTVVNKACEQCGVQFTPNVYTPAQRFCSRQCQNGAAYAATARAAAAHPVARCEWCGNGLRGRPPSTGFRRYCSDECNRESQNVTHTEAYALTQRYEGVCMLCGETQRWEWTPEQYAAQRPRKCPRCDGRMFVDREAGAREANPRFTGDVVSGDQLTGPLVRTPLAEQKPKHSNRGEGGRWMGSVA